jgi:heat shock protein 5
LIALLQQTTTIMIRRPTCAQSRHIFPSLSIAFFALLAFVCFTQPVQAEEAHPEYGSVIGIGM